jgi:hypothetical protein
LRFRAWIAWRVFSDLCSEFDEGCSEDTRGLCALRRLRAQSPRGIRRRRRRRHLTHTSGSILINRDNSVSTGISAVGVNPDYSTEVRWWTTREFTGRAVLEAAELGAFDVLDPVLRSRKRVKGIAGPSTSITVSRQEFKICFFWGRPAPLSCQHYREFWRDSRLWRNDRQL